MRRFFTLLKREIRHYFHQPLAYIVLFCFLLIIGFIFQLGVGALNRATSQTTLVEAFFDSILLWFPFILTFPLLTMRLFSEEYKLGTIETLMTAPVGDLAVVLSKYVGALAFYLILWVPTLLYFVIFHVVTGQSAAQSFSQYFGSYLLLFLVGAFYLAIGCLASSLTSNQIVAAIVSFALICLMFFLSVVTFVFPSADRFLGDIVYYFSTIEHMADFSQGVFDTRPIALYLSLTLFTLFLTFHVFQHRRWRS